MNSKAINFIKNFSYTLSSNLISLIVSSLVVLIIPKLIGVKEYGLWQLYLFYSSYVGFMHFGWNDGIYLRYGGEKYEDLDKQLLFSQFTMLFFLQFLIAILIVICSIFSINDVNRLFILQMLALVLVIENMRTMLLFILQATNKIKNYAQITMMDRIVYIILLSLFLLFGVREYKLMIVADVTSKALSFLYAMYCCKEIVFRRISVFSLSIREAVENINVGIRLMFANIASMLIIGVVRFGIERSWDVSTFGKVSLTLSISRLTMLFINAVGIIMFPLLRRTDERRLPHIYGVMRDILMTISLGVLIVYYPLKIIMISWLPEYTEGLSYMALVFPLFIYEGKMALLINTYLKTLRQEKLMLRINVISLVLSISSTLFTVNLVKNLDLAVVSIVLILAFRSALAELLLAKKLRISVVKDVFLEIVLTLIFILSGWFIDSWYTVLVYSIAYIVYLFIKHKDINNTVKNIKILIKPEEAI